MVYVLWECPVYDTIRNTYIHGKIRQLVVGVSKSLVQLIIFERTGFVLGVRIGIGVILRVYQVQLRILYIQHGILGKMNCVVFRMVRHQVALVL